MALVLIAAFTGPVAAALPDKKMNFLIRFFDMNEAAFAYHRHCVGPKPVIDRSFVKTMKLVADELLAKAIVDNPQAKPEEIKSTIMERRYDLQYKLDTASMQDGCNSRDALIAKAHYEEFSRFDVNQINLFIEEQTSN
ncbi:MAG: hypothetical protein WBK55_04460 [Alphaproteobacteria bacterium]